MRIAPALGLAIATSGIAMGRSTLFINFEETLPGMNNIPGALIPAASRLSDQYLVTHNVRFSSGSAYVPVVNLGSQTPSPTRGIGGSTGDGRLTYSSAFPVVIRFLSADATQPMVVSMVTIYGDTFPIAGTKSLTAFNVAGAVLGSVTVPDGPLPLVFSAPGIHRVEVTGSSATIAFDDLSFDTPVLACATCPGDADANFMVGLSDVAAIISCWSMPASCNICADLDQDGTIGLGDIAQAVQNWASTCR